MTLSSPRYPQTRKLQHVDTYFGHEVNDPYRWLEETQSKEVAEWVAEQNTVTSEYLESIPFRKRIAERLRTIWDYPKYSQPFRAHGRLFFFKNDGLQNQSVLYWQEEGSEESHVFLDFNRLSEDGTVALAGYSISADDKYFAYGIARSGSDWNEWRVIDIATGEHLSDRLDRVKFSTAAWHRDGFYYGRYDAVNEERSHSEKNEYHKIYYHKLGTSQEDDVLIYHDDIHPERLHFVSTTDEEDLLVMHVSEGSRKGNLLYAMDLRSGNPAMLPIIDEFGSDNIAIESHEGSLLVLTSRDASNKRLVLIDPKHPAPTHWKTIVPEQEYVLEGVNFVGGLIFAIYLKDASNHVFVYDIEGTNHGEIHIPSLGSVWGFDGRKRDSIIYYTLTSFTIPTSIYEYDIRTRSSRLVRRSEINFDFDNYETRQIFYESTDGVRVPMFIVHRKGLAMTGDNPAYLTAYGGFNMSLTPSFSISRLVLLEQGAVIATPNIRGGGEYGEQWHEAGMKLGKKQVFKDFIAAADYLFREGYTSPERLAIAGGSNGGLLVGAVMTERPDICAVALPSVGVMDMLRFHKFTIGWGWSKEYGTSDEEEHFHNLLSYSPLHRLCEGKEYPATLVTTADHDDRVVPLHSYKFAARLQECQSGPAPVLLRVDVKSGHGGGKPTSKVIEELSDTFAFFFANIGFTPRFDP